MACLRYRLKDEPVRCTEYTTRLIGTVRGTARKPHFSRVIIYVNFAYRYVWLHVKKHSPGVWQIPPETSYILYPS